MSDDDAAAAEPSPDDFLAVPDPRFEPGTVAIVSGAGSGIGRATATGLAVNGLTVVGIDIDAEGMAETRDRIEGMDVEGRFVSYEGDLTDDDEMAAAVDAAAEEGQIRYLANVAGLQHIAPLQDFPMEKYDLLLDVMLRGPFLLSKLVFPHVMEADDGVGAIGNMSSIHGHYATKDKPAYITAKHGLQGLTRAIAAQGEGTLRGFSVSVGYVETPLMQNQIADTAEERGISEREVIEDVMLGQARTKELMQPAEVANLFVFGFSEYARHLNGGDLLFDGGYVHTYE